MKYYTIGYGVQGNDPYLLKNIDDISTNIVQPLFNGNIMAMATALPTVVPGTPPTFLLQEDVLIQAYKYDQLNRIYQANSFKMSTINAQSLNPTGTSAFFSEYNYDDNGNITSLKRKDLSGNLFDDFSYNYTNISENNKLNYVAENPGISSSLHNSDIDNTQISGNYQYDEIGNLIEDVSENIDAITWNVYGKIASIDKSGTGNSDLEFAYDPAGNRILKKVTTSTGIVTKTWYIRDAQGNIMSTYQQTEEIYSWQSAHIYGSSRIGVYNANITLVENDVPVEPETQTTLQFTRGLKHYEITNHLGNVLSVITDKKIAQVVTYSGTNYKVFDPDVVSFTDYYPFGSPMVGRGWEAGNTGKYRFSFNGKEEDNEVTVDGGTIAFEARIYDSRICRFLSTDPLAAEYSYQSTYVFAHNCPITLIDFLGMGDPKDPPFKQASASDGTSFTIPTAAKTEIINDRVRAFTLSNGDRYVNAFNKDGEFLGYVNAKSGSYYQMRNSAAAINMAILPDKTLVEQDVSQAGFSAYSADTECFNELEKESNGSFVTIEVSNINDAANKIRDYCEANACTVANMIIDFHGDPHVQSKVDGFLIGSTNFNSDLAIKDYSSCFTLIGSFMNGSSKVLMGHCCIARWHKPELKLISQYFNNAAIFAHMTYTMSLNVCVTGNFANKFAQAFSEFDDLDNVGKWDMIIGTTVTRVKNVRFGTGRPEAMTQSAYDRNYQGNQGVITYDK